MYATDLVIMSVPLSVKVYKTNETSLFFFVVFGCEGLSIFFFFKLRLIPAIGPFSTSLTVILFESTSLSLYLNSIEHRSCSPFKLLIDLRKIKVNC